MSGFGSGESLITVIGLLDRILTIYQTFEEILEKSSIFMFYRLFCKIIFHWPKKISSYDSETDPAGSATNWPPGSGSGSVIKDYGSVDPASEKIFMDSQHWILAKCVRSIVAVPEVNNTSICKALCVSFRGSIKGRRLLVGSKAV